MQTQTSKQPIDILREMRELLAEPERWTQSVLAKSKFGNAVTTRSPRAVSWCLLGAHYRVTNGWTASDAWDILQRAAGVSSLSFWNDAPGRTHAEVLALLDSCIADLEAKQ